MSMYSKDIDTIGQLHYTYKLRNLYLKDNVLFKQLVDFLPYSVHINNRSDLSIKFMSNNLKNKADEIDTLFKVGSSYLKKITSPHYLKYANDIITSFDKKNDKFSVCSYPQLIDIKSQKIKLFLRTNKLILDQNHFFNINSITENIQSTDQLFNEVFDVKSEFGIFYKFMHLTKKEKLVMEHLAQGYSKKEIANLLYLSPHTIHTHRRNIYAKLNITKIHELVRIAQLMGVT